MAGKPVLLFVVAFIFMAIQLQPFIFIVSFCRFHLLWNCGI